MVELPIEVSLLLPLLRIIDFSGNQLYDVCPKHLQKLTNLESYFVEDSNIEGSILGRITDTFP